MPPARRQGSKRPLTAINSLPGWTARALHRVIASQTGFPIMDTIAHDVKTNPSDRRRSDWLGPPLVTLRQRAFDTACADLMRQVEFELLESTEHDDVLDDSRGRLVAEVKRTPECSGTW